MNLKMMDAEGWKYNPENGACRENRFRERSSNSPEYPHVGVNIAPVAKSQPRHKDRHEKADDSGPGRGPAQHQHEDQQGDYRQHCEGCLCGQVHSPFLENI